MADQLVRASDLQPGMVVRFCTWPTHLQRTVVSVTAVDGRYEIQFVPGETDGDPRAPRKDSMHDSGVHPRFVIVT